VTSHNIDYVKFTIIYRKFYQNVAKIPLFQVVDASRLAKPVKVLHISQAVFEYRHERKNHRHSPNATSFDWSPSLTNALPIS
jgi:hypothetical protein